jgi:SAM-dependent methyltransferase
MRNAYALPETHDFLWEQLADLPYFRAVLRAVESRFYQELPIVGPVLDLGSGDGSFAAQTFSKPLDVGLDPWRGPLWFSREKPTHNLRTLSDGARMPFTDASFQTVISNSVLEHIPDLEPVMAETYRVMRPGGYFLFCSPSEYFTDWFVGTKLFGERYRKFFNLISRHQHCDSPDQWRARLERQGFEIEKIWYYFSPHAARVLEAGHVIGLPNMLTKKLFGKWVLFPTHNNPFLNFLYKQLKPIYDEKPGSKGAYLFVIAKKPA